MNEDNQLIPIYDSYGEGRHFDDWGYVKIYLKFSTLKYIEDIGYEYKGCPIIAHSLGVFIKKIKGLEIDEAIRFSENIVTNHTVEKNCKDCNTMIIVAFLNACDEYKNK